VQQQQQRSLLRPPPSTPTSPKPQPRPPLPAPPRAPARWITPYFNGAIPTLLVRAKLVELLTLLPLDTGLDSLREVLQRSGLGKVVHFNSGYQGDGSDREWRLCFGGW